MGRDLATTSDLVFLDELASPPIQAAAVSGDFVARATVKLRILATSDLHANLLAWDYHANTICHTRGLARTATLIVAARQEAGNCLLLDNGDFLNGTALGDHLALTQDASRPHPMIAAMNHLRYDAATLGNHEFSHGLAVLSRSLRDAAFPIVASNLHLTSPHALPIALPYVMLIRDVVDSNGTTQRLRIAVVGFLPPQTITWEQRHLKHHATTGDILQSAAALIPALRADGADLVIALSHSGIGHGLPGPFDENVSHALAAIDGIDVIIAGHTHLVFPTPDRTGLAGKPVVMPGFFGSHLGVIDLTLRRGQDITGEARTWDITDHHAHTRAIAHRNPDGGAAQALVGNDPAIVALATPDHLALQHWSGQPIGHTDIALHSFFALLGHSPALDLVAKAQTRHLTRALQNGPHDPLPVLSAVAPFKSGGRGGPENYTHIPAGPLLRRHAGDLYVHPNSLVGLRITGMALRRWLERSVSLFYQITPGACDTCLINLDFPSYDFDVIHGLTYQVDLSQPARFDRSGAEVAPHGNRIRQLSYHDQPVAPDQIFAMASNSYRCAGGHGFAGPKPPAVIYEAQLSNRDLVEGFICDGGQSTQPHLPHWGFVPMPGTTVLFDCDPRATAALGDVPHLQLEPLLRLPTGFQRFRLHL